MTQWITEVLSGGRRRSGVVAAGLSVALLTAACGAGPSLTTMRAEAIGVLLRSMSEDSVIRLAGGDTLRLSPSTLAFYRGRDFQAAWVGPKGPLPQAAAVHRAIGNARADGLPPVRYRHDVATEVLAGIEAEGDARLSDSLAVRHLADLDVLLTEGFNRLARDLVAGMLDPVQAGLDYRMVKDEPPVDAILSRVLDGELPEEVIAQLRPTIPHYDRMRAVLLTLYGAEKRGGWTQVHADSTLSEGGRADAVTQVRRRLIEGVNIQEAGLARSGAADPSLFDAALKRAVVLFQDRHAIEPDGTVGAATLRELNHTIAERIAEVRLNLDRWRWLPDDLGDRYVIVNIAGFEMEVVDQGRIIESMDVVVGQTTTATPIFSDSIRYVVVNPYWNVPDGIMERTIRPAMAADPDYLRKHDMEIADGRVRQRPGPQNSLGRYKFIFPNDFDVYLHDTPDGHLFSRAARAFSSGCVRVERPRDFARMLLELQSDRDPDSLDGILATENEQWIRLDRPLPVYILYFTAWAQEDGTVRYHHDVYGRSEAMDGQVGEMVTPVSS
ncbi:MAG: L,D-transpeptidase family protein [Gemmatimonadetes bacterium]|nr:L,D-transpeptidase family protein [Gemmatimonadota bacterium]